VEPGTVDHTTTLPHKNITAADLGIDVRSGDERELFKWLLASFLFGKRIQQTVAAQAWRALVERHGLDAPGKICRRPWQELVNILGEGHYVRYDESTADRLLKLCHKLDEEYGGKLSRLRELSADRAEIERRLLEFEGIGPKTVQIFMREAAQVWS
jgi:endonuclease III